MLLVHTFLSSLVWPELAQQFGGVFKKSLWSFSLHSIECSLNQDLNSLVKLVRVNITAEKGAIEGKESNGDCLHQTLQIKLA